MKLCNTFSAVYLIKCKALSESSNICASYTLFFFTPNLLCTTCVCARFVSVKLKFIYLLTHLTNWGVGYIVSDELTPLHHSQCPASVRLIVRDRQSGAYEPRAWQWFLSLSDVPRFLDACFPKRPLDLCRDDSAKSQNRSKSVLLCAKMCAFVRNIHFAGQSKQVVASSRASKNHNGKTIRFCMRLLRGS